MKRYSSVTLHVSPQNPISREELKIPFTINPNFHLKKKLLSDLVKNKLKLYVFRMDFITNQHKLIVPKKCGFRSWKGSNIWTLLYSLESNQEKFILSCCNWAMFRSAGASIVAHHLASSWMEANLGRDQVTVATDIHPLGLGLILTSRARLTSMCRCCLTRCGGRPLTPSWCSWET